MAENYSPQPKANPTLRFNGVVSNDAFGANPAGCLLLDEWQLLARGGDCAQVYAAKRVIEPGSGGVENRTRRRSRIRDGSGCRREVVIGSWGSCVGALRLEVAVAAAWFTLRTGFVPALCCGDARN